MFGLSPVWQLQKSSFPTKAKTGVDSPEDTRYSIGICSTAQIRPPGSTKKQSLYIIIRDDENKCHYCDAPLNLRA